MSKVVVCTMISLDGCTEGRDGDVTAMPVDDAFNEFIAERARPAGHFLFGATSYRGMDEFWPHQVDNPEANSWDRYIASRFAGDALLTVISDRLTRGDVRVHRAFTAVPETTLRLLGVRSWRDSDNVVLHYATDSP